MSWVAAGSLLRLGTYSELHLVDEGIAGHAPSTIDPDAAAALPLTSNTVWEMLVDRLQVDQTKTIAAGAFMIVGGAGGVGSMVQLARQAAMQERQPKTTTFKYSAISGPHFS